MFIGKSNQSKFMDQVLKEAKKIELKKIETIVKPPYYAMKLTTDENLEDGEIKNKVKNELVSYIHKSEKIKSSLIEALKKEGKSEEEATKTVTDKWTKEVIKKTVKMQTQKGKDGKWKVIIGYTPVTKTTSKLAAVTNSADMIPAKGDIVSQVIVQDIGDIFADISFKSGKQITAHIHRK